MAPSAVAKPSGPQHPLINHRQRKHTGGRTLARTVPLFPAFGLLAVFLVAPIFSSFYGSFTNSSLTGAAAQGATFIGFENYLALFTDSNFLKSILLTVVFLIGSAIIGQNVLGLGLAMLMQHSNRVIRSCVGTFVVTAWILPEIVAAFASYAFFHVDGTLNGILKMIGIAGPNWLYSLPLLAVILANTWRGAAFSMLLYTAALADVPDDVQESAAMDGASGLKKIAYITLPMIRRSVSTNLMLTTLQTLSVFTLIFVMTGGGPGINSSTLPVLAYQEAFKFSQLGLGTAIATVLLLVGAAFSVIYIRALKPGVD